MATLKFNAKKVEKLVQHALAAVQHTRSYGQNNDPAPALHLVMDGMYLISNGEPHLPGSACGQSALNAVVYAEGYEPPNRLPQVGNELLTAAGYAPLSCERRMVIVKKIKGAMAQANPNPTTNFSEETCGVSPASLAARSRNNNPTKI